MEEPQTDGHPLLLSTMLTIVIVPNHNTDNVIVILQQEYCQSWEPESSNPYTGEGFTVYGM